ncbi:MAG TPA: hypothetical protein DIV40_05940 [Clostridiales bacterium]|nr:hypothetical protein [Clostridiales bacterium]
MSLGIAMIYGGQAFLASDRRVTLLDESGNNTNVQHDKNKLHKVGVTYFTAMGVEPLTTWVINKIKKLKDFDIQKVVMICRELEQIFKNKLDTEIKEAQWLNDGSVESLAVLWASENPEPEIGLISSFEGYKVTTERTQGRLLAKSAVNTEKMLSIIINQFKAEHESLIHILNDIFVEANAYDNAISSSFDVGFTNRSYKKIYVNKIAAGTITAKIEVISPVIKSGDIYSSKFYGSAVNSAYLVVGTQGGNYGDIQVFRGGGNGLTFGIYDNIGSVDFQTTDLYGVVRSFLNSSGDTTRPQKIWDFSQADSIVWGSNYPAKRFS